MSKDVIYSLKNVGLYYKKMAILPWKQNAKFWALRDVSFDVHRGETLGIIGRNGAGKSTLLQILANILKPDRGEVHRANNIVATLLTLGVGFEPRLTGRLNVVISGMLLGMSRREMLRRTDAILDIADIGSHIDQPIYTYSSGMKARLGFAIAYHVDADVMLLDETLAPGDHAFRRKASDLIKNKIRSNKTVIMVMHAMPVIEELCDRVIQIEEGLSLPERSIDESVEDYLSRRPIGRNGREPEPHPHPRRTK